MQGFPRQPLLQGRTGRALLRMQSALPAAVWYPAKFIDVYSKDISRIGAPQIYTQSFFHQKTSAGCAPVKTQE